MKKYIFIGLGGFLGAICRYLIKGINISNFSGRFPINTLLTNITGSFVAAYIAGYYMITLFRQKM